MVLVAVGNAEFIYVSTFSDSKCLTVYYSQVSDLDLYQLKVFSGSCEESNFKVVEHMRV